MKTQEIQESVLRYRNILTEAEALEDEAIIDIAQINIDKLQEKLQVINKSGLLTLIEHCKSFGGRVSTSKDGPSVYVTINGDSHCKDTVRTDIYRFIPNVYLHHAVNGLSGDEFEYREIKEIKEIT